MPVKRLDPPKFKIILHNDMQEDHLNCGICGGTKLKHRYRFNFLMEIHFLR